MRARLGTNLFGRRRTRPPAPVEFSTHVMIADALRRWASPDWQWSHFPAGEYRTPATAARLSRMGVRAGWPDFILIPPTGRLHCLELKRARTGRLNDAQQEFAVWCKEHGVPFAIARDFSEALAVLQGWGAVRGDVKISA
jgi:hypothetical protein